MVEEIRPRTGEPVDAVRAFFAAWRAGDDAAPFVTGRLDLLTGLTGALRASGDLLGQEVELRRATLLELRDREALVDVEGSLRTTIRDPLYGTVTVHEEDLTGPVKALLVDGDWRVADYCSDGRRALSGLSTNVHGAGSARGLDATSIAVRTAYSLTFLYVELGNSRADAVIVRRANLNLNRFTSKRFGRVFGRRTIEPGERRLILLAWPVALRQASRQVRLLAFGDAAQERIEVRFGVRLEPADLAYFEPLRIGGDPLPPPEPGDELER